MTDFDPQAWLEPGRANRDKLPDGVVLPESQIDYERYRDALQRFVGRAGYTVSEPMSFTDKGLVIALLAVADEVIALRDGPKADGWIDWHGGECPGPASPRVAVRFRNGDVHFGREWNWWNWWHEGGDYTHDIVAYRVVEEN